MEIPSIELGCWMGSEGDLALWTANEEMPPQQQRRRLGVKYLKARLEALRSARMGPGNRKETHCR